MLVGTGPSFGANSVLLYNAPFTTAPSPDYDLSTGTCATAPAGPTAIALWVDGGDPLESSIYIASYYNNNVAEYSASNFFAKLGGSVNTCPTALTNGNGINKVEGMAVDTYGNVFVSNSGNSGTNANTIAVYTGGSSFSN